jgi:hypothetical protein
LFVPPKFEKGTNDLDYWRIACFTFLPTQKFSLGHCEVGTQRLLKCCEPDLDSIAIKKLDCGFEVEESNNRSIRDMFEANQDRSENEG